MANHPKLPAKDDVLMCNLCGEEKPDDLFPRQEARKYNRHRDPRCRECMKSLKATPRQRALARVQERRRKCVSMGTTEASVIARFEASGRRCEACGRTLELWAKNMHMDHDHSTGMFRGILCSSCNTTLGIFDEDVDRIMSLVAYKLSHTNVLEDVTSFNLAGPANTTQKVVV